MFTVKKKALTSNIIWDAENNQPLCRFVNGIFQTEDKAAASKLAEMGYEVTSDSVENTEDVPETQEATKTRRGRK
jgi:spermidine/putrescine-binding protein